jgi:hypothetical protein
MRKVRVMTHSQSKKRIVRVFTSFPSGNNLLDIITAGFRAEDSETELIVNKSGRCNLAVVVNFSRGFHYIWGRDSQVIKWLMEPELHGRVNWRFTHKHSAIYDRIFTHSPSPQSQRELLTPPFVFPHVEALDPESLIRSKTKIISAICSVQTALPFHAVRKQLVDDIESSPRYGVDVFGKGRNFIQSKLDGLQDYRYSIAIENSVTEHYWTEKLTDCFLSMTVPIYLGAPNASNYFPAESMIEVTEKDLSTGFEAVLSQLTVDDYERRIPFLFKARELVLENYNFGREIAKLADVADSQTRWASPMSRVWTLDTWIFMVYEVASKVRTLLGRWGLNVREQTGREPGTRSSG